MKELVAAEPGETSASFEDGLSVGAGSLSADRMRARI